jgi:acetyltransferase
MEVLKDTATALTPLSSKEALSMIHSLKSYPLINGYRNQTRIDEYAFAEILTRISIFLQTAPEIKEMDINPLIGINKQIIAVDARIIIDK